MNNYPNITHYKWFRLLICVLLSLVATIMAYGAINNSYGGMEFLLAGVFGRPETLGVYLRKAVILSILAGIASVITVVALWIFHIHGSDTIGADKRTVILSRISAAILTIVIFGTTVQASYGYARLLRVAQHVEMINVGKDIEKASYALQQESAAILHMTGIASARLMLSLAIIGLLLPGAYLSKGSVR
jgi:hypothetical protein